MSKLSVHNGDKRSDFLKDETLVDIFKDTVREFGGKEAIVFGERSLTYSDLDNLSDNFAAYLQSQGLGSGEPCLVWWPRGLELHIAILAVIKCGATYVPLDHEMPIDRVEAVKKDISAKFIITNHSCNLEEIKVLHVETSYTGELHPIDFSNQNNAYVLYTSGSTGKPKGIAISHQNICHLIRSENHVLEINEQDKVYQGFSVSFDMWCEETWISFLAGATIYVADSITAKSIDNLSMVLLEHEITVLHAVPSLLAVMDEIHLPKLRIVNAGGEACTRQVLDKWAKDGRAFYNSYGPTETTVSSNFAKLERDSIITIGKPLANYGLAVVDENLHPVKIGEQGELVISGPGVSNGYIGLDKLTEEKFKLKNEALIELHGEKIYRTGDAVFMDENMDIHFLGRIDDQVKLRGYRIELGEIESLLNEQSGVKQAAIAIKKDANDQEQLTGYVLMERTANFDETILKEHLSKKLPSYMVPYCIVAVEDFPRLPSGKINRKELPIPNLYQIKYDLVDFAIEDNDLIQEKIRKLLSQVFAKNINDFQLDFFNDLGGHSMLAASFVSKIRSLGIRQDASLKDIYSHRPLSNLLDFWTQTQVQSLAEDQEAFEPVPKIRYLLCTIAQTLSLFLIFGLFSMEIFIPYLSYYFTLLETNSHFLALVDSLLCFCLLPPALILIGVGLKWIILGKAKEGDYPLWGSYYFRWWFANTILKIVPTQFFNGTPLYPKLLNLLGSKIAHDAHISAMSVGTYDLIEIGRNVTISSKVLLDNATIENGLLKLRKIKIGDFAYVGSSCVIGSNSEMRPWSELSDLSYLKNGESIPQGQIWQGSPAKFLRKKTEDETTSPEIVSQHSLNRYSVLYTILLGIFPLLVLMPLIPTIIILAELDNLAPEYQFYYLWITPILTIIYVFLFATENILISRWLSNEIKPGTLSIYSKTYVKKWFVDQINALSLIVLHPLYASVFIGKYFRALGAKVGKNTEISTASDVTHKLLEIGDNSFIADSVTLGEYDVRSNQLILNETKIGSKTFIGNSALIPQGYQVPNNKLIGVLSIPPSKERIESENGDWFGSPAINLPRRQESESFDLSLTFDPPRSLYLKRLFIESLRIILPQTVILICSVFFIAYTSDLIAYEPMWLILLQLPFYYLIIFALPIFVCSLLVKWILVGRIAPEQNPMWSWKVWKTEFVTTTYEALCVPFLLEFLKGTAWLPILLKCFGVKIGKRVYLDTTDFTEHDLTSIGDDSALGQDCGAQTHLFEDRIMKMGRVTIGNRVSIGGHTIILYDSEIKNDVKIEPLSLVMKGESLPEKTKWIGSPVSKL